MLEDLFITDTPGSNIGADIELSEQIENWPMEIQSIIMSQAPVLMDAQGQLNFTSVDQDKLYAKGAYIVPVGMDTSNAITFPILVKAGKLLPIDMYIYNNEWHVFDPQEVSAILTSPELGDELIANKDIPPIIYNSLMGRVTPPGGYGSGVVSSVATKMGAFNRDKSLELIDLVKRNPVITAKLKHNKLAAKRFTAVLDATPENIKQASGSISGKEALKGNKIIYSIGNGKFTVKSARIHNGIIASGSLECDGDILATWLKEAKLDTKRILTELSQTKMAFTWDDSNFKNEVHSDTIKAAGMYTCYDSSVKPVVSEVLGYVKTALDEKSYIAINSNGTYSSQRELIGSPLVGTTEKTASFGYTDIKTGDVITTTLHTKEAGLPELSAPTTVTSIVSCGTNESDSYTVISGSSAHGKIAYVTSAKDDIKAPIYTKYVPEGLMIDKLAEVWYLPQNQKIYKLPKDKTVLIKTADEMSRSVFLSKEGYKPTEKITLWGIDRYSIGVKIGSAAPQITSKSDAMLIIKQCQNGGVLETMSKIASGTIKVLDLVTGGPGRSSYIASKTKSLDVKDMDKKMKQVLNTSSKIALLKIAADMTDEEDLDSVLALNYLTPENMSEFQDLLPSLKKAEEGLVRLLMSIRLGNSLADEQDVKTAVQTIHGIVKELDTGM